MQPSAQFKIALQIARFVATVHIWHESVAPHMGTVDDCGQYQFLDYGSEAAMDSQTIIQTVLSMNLYLFDLGLEQRQ